MVDEARTPDSAPGDERDREHGRDMWREVMRFDAPPATDPYIEVTTEHVFGRLWTRPGLSMRDRRLVSMTVIALRGLKEPLLAHMSAALDSGDFEPDELQEWVLHIAHYAGWPIGANAYAVLREVLSHPAGRNQR
jgi:4-carboxymuconolactone decarboxylase